MTYANAHRRHRSGQMDFDLIGTDITAEQAFEAQGRTVGLLLKFLGWEDLSVEEILATTDIREIVRDILEPVGIFARVKDRLTEEEST